MTVEEAARLGKREAAVLSGTSKMRIYEAMEAMKRRSPFPRDYDPNAAREAAFEEKYGRFD